MTDPLASTHQAAADARPPLFGRERERDCLAQVLDSAHAPHPRGALLVGDPGMGKTRLLGDCCSSRPGVLVAQARIGDRLVPYAMLARMLRRLVTLAPQAIGHMPAAERATLLPEWADPAHPFTPVSPKAASLRAVLQHASPAVSAWALDDLQWADDASAELLLGLLTTAARDHLPWIIATQPPEAGSVAEALLEAASGLPGVESVLLPPLSRQTVFDWMLAQDPGGGPAGGRATRADAWTGRLMARTGGQPLHIELLLRWAVGDTPSPDPERTQLPALLTLIGQRLAQASAPALHVARAASIAGQDVSLPMLARLGAMDDEPLRDALAELERLGIWAGSDFSHARMREGARQATPDILARELHARSAAWLEEQGGEPARIAAHWQAAHEDARSLPALLRAAARARQLGCTADRLAFLMRAAGLAEAQGDIDLAFDCCSQAFESHTEAIRHTEGQALLAQMTHLARTPAQLARSAIHHAWHALVHGRIDEAVAQGEAALAQGDALGDPDLQGPSRQILGTALGVAGQLSRGLALMEAARDWVDSHLPDEERATFHGNLASVLDNLGRADDAGRHHRAALDLAEREQAGPQHRATLLANFALSRLEAGDPRGARDLAQQGQALLERTPVEASSQAGFLAVLLAPAQRTLGHYASALAWCDRAESVLAQRNPSRMPVALLQRAHVWMDLGQHDRALSVLGGPGLPVGRQLPARHAVRWLLLLARAQTRCGLDPRTALAEARAGLPAEGWPELPLLLRQEAALVMPGARAATELAAVAEDAIQAGLPGVALGAWLQCALLAAVGAQQPELARRAALSSQQLLEAGAESTHVDRALRWLGPARAWAACGDAAAARALIAQGREWLLQTTRMHVPPEAAQAFLTQNPLNLSLGETDIDSL